MVNKLAVGMIVGVLAMVAANGRAEPEVNGWGELRGIRLNGELVGMSTGLRMRGVADANAGGGGRGNGGGGPEVVQMSAGRVTNPRFVRQGARQTFTGTMAFRDAAQAMNFRQTVDDGADSAAIDITGTAAGDLNTSAVEFVVGLPVGEFANGTVTFEDAAAGAGGAITLTPPPPTAGRANGGGGGGRGGGQGVPVERFYSGAVKALTVTTARRTLRVNFAERTAVVIEGSMRGYSIVLPLHEGALARNATVHAALTITVGGEVDTFPAMVAVDAAKPGSPFEGLGGNFRIQSGQDAAHIAYNLEHLRLAWGRVSMPLDLFQPNEAGDPMGAAPAQLNTQVRQAMEMGRTLAEKKIALVASAWQLPAWAVVMPQGRGGGGGGGASRRINPDKLGAVAKLVADYLDYMKKHYGAEADLFSFNESDIGINVLQTAAEHDLMIKTFGPVFAARGLKTKLLLGDTSNAMKIQFVQDALNDAAARPFIGAVAFHSWHGGTNQTFAGWGEAARQLGVPLLCAEGGTDPDAYRYAGIFEEPWYGLDEIDVYVRICAAAQPASILQWQLTENYSVLLGGGRGGGGGGLRPGTRFYLLQQLNLIPPGAKALPVTIDRPAISACAYGDGKEAVLVHLLNNGAARAVTVTGLPASVKELRRVVTVVKPGVEGAKEGDPVAVVNGTAKVMLEPMTFVTLTNGHGN